MIELFTDKQNCSGCTACMSICPRNALSMINDSEGFLYPAIDYANCNECGLCIDVCPFYDGFKIDGNNKTSEVYAVKHNSLDVRLASTSGGMFTALSDVILQKGGAVYGAAFDEDLRVVHIKALNDADRNKLRGSKYVQSDLKEVFKNIRTDLRVGSEVLFTGTPCQTAGLFTYLKKRKTDLSKLYLCDIVCHGTPSPKIFADYKNFVQTKYGSKITKFFFRYKGVSWRDINLFAEFENGEIKINTDELNVFKNIFNENLALRPACYNCKFTNLSRSSDITIADYWGIENIKPHMDDSKGVSLVLVNSNRGAILFQKASIKLTVEKSEVADCLIRQPQLKSPSLRPAMRNVFWNDYNKKGFLFIIKKYASYGTWAKVAQFMKEILKKPLQKMGLMGKTRGIIAWVNYRKNRLQ